MLGRASKALLSGRQAALFGLQQGLGGALLRQPGTPGSRLLAAGSGAARQRYDDSEDAARTAAQDLARAAHASVAHAAQGDLGSVAQDAARMAEAGMRGAAESARLVVGTATGWDMPSGRQGSSAVGSAAASAVDAASQGADDLAQGTAAAYCQTVGAMSETTVPGGGAPGPESTYHGHALRDQGTVSDSATGDWAGVMVQSAADEGFHSSASSSEGGIEGALGGEDLGATQKGSGAGGTGFAGSEERMESGGGDSVRGHADDEFPPGEGSAGAGSDAVGAQGLGRGEQHTAGSSGGGDVPRVSERSFNGDEFGVTKEGGP